MFDDKSKPMAVITPDANLFACTFAAGVVAQNGLSDNTLPSLQAGWLIHKQFIAWVNEGGDVKEFERQQRVAKAAADKKASVEYEDKRLEAERRAKDKADFGVKV